jgi:ArsR family transcriptional regulator, virulence genes transcriptional regulator
MNKLNLDRAQRMLEVLTNSSVKRIIALLQKDGEMTVGSITARLELCHINRTSMLLRDLRSFDIVKTERDGKFIYYSVNHIKLKKINFAMKNFFTSTENAVFA